MAESDARPTTGVPALLPPRAAAHDVVLWAEPWHFAARPRPDDGDAGRRPGGVPSPRSGD